MKPLAQWSDAAKILTVLSTVAVSGSAILAFAGDIEPIAPATRSWVRGLMQVSSAEADDKLTKANALTNQKLEALTFQTFDIQLTLLTAALQQLKGEELMLQKRLQLTPDDSLLAARLTEVQANIRTNEADAGAIRCDIAKRKGWPCGPER